MPVLPEVGSISTVLPGLILPWASSASIIETPMRSLTEAIGLKNSSLAEQVGLDASSAASAVEAHQRRVADGLGDGVVNLAASRLFRVR